MLVPASGFLLSCGTNSLIESGLCSNSLSPERSPRLFSFKEPSPSTAAPSLAQLFYSFLIHCGLTYNQPPALLLIMKPRGPGGGCVPSRKIPSHLLSQEGGGRAFCEAACHSEKPSTAGPGWRAAWASLGSALSSRTVKGKRILQNLCAWPEEANLYLGTKETPRCLGSFALKWLKEKQKRQGGQTCPHEDIHSWEGRGQGMFKGKKLRSGQIYGSRGHGVRRSQHGMAGSSQKGLPVQPHSHARRPSAASSAKCQTPLLHCSPSWGASLPRPQGLALHLSGC